MSDPRRESAAVVHDYLQERRPDIAGVHPAFGVDLPFNEEKSRYEARQKQKELMDALEAWGKMDDHKLHFNPATCSWEDMFRELEKAQKSLLGESGATGDGHRLPTQQKLSQKLWRGTSSVLNIFGPMLEAIPDEFGYIKGSLGVIFNIIQTRVQLRREILDAFEDLPEIIAMACSKSRNFPSDNNLQSSIHDLKCVLFDAIPRLVDILAPGCALFAKLIGPFRRLTAEELISLIKRSAAKVESCASNLRDDMIVGNFWVAKDVQKTSQVIQVNVEEINDGMSIVDQRLMQLQERQHYMSQQLEDAMTSQNGLFDVLQDFVFGVLLAQDSPASPGQPRNQARPQSEREPAQPEQLATILYALNVDQRQPNHDISFVLRQTREYDTQAKAFLGAILADPHFQDWMAYVGCAALFVEGRLDSSRFGRTSPISYVCANLMRAFIPRDDVTTLHFFCGQHTASNDPLRGPKGMIRSLLAQLLHRWPKVSVRGVHLHGFDGEPDSVHFEDLCDVFRLALSQVPTYNSVLCMIDDISRFENEAWANDYLYLMDLLHNVIMGQGVNVRFKLLLTSPTRSRRLHTQVLAAQCIELREDAREIGPGRRQAMFQAFRSSSL